MEWKVAALVAVCFLIFAGYCYYRNHKWNMQLQRKIKRTWGTRPAREYSVPEFDAISHHFLRKEHSGFSVDDTTWNDLDMDTIFMLLNHTWSCVGESYLYSMLRTPSFSEEELKERERLIRFFGEHPEKREQFELFFAKIGKTGAHSIFDYIYNLADYEKESNGLHYLCIGAFVAAAISVAVNPPVGVLLLLGSLAFCWGTYFSRRKKIEPYVLSCSCLLEILRAADKITEMKTPEVDNYLKEITEGKKQFAKFKRNSYFFIVGSNQNLGGGIWESLMAYLNFTLHLDLIQFQTLAEEVQKHMDAFELLTDNMGILETAIAIASFREMMKEWCVPTLKTEKKLSLETENIYHPMIAEPVKNSLSVKNGVLLTGSNASGKSTFLKTVAINAILAQTIHTCMADRYEGHFCQVYSSMALKDDLVNQESYYIVEIKTLKRILDHLDDEVPVFCFVDEVLRGTNTVERIAASTQILKSMAKDHVLCFAATHDIELTHLLEGVYSNYHFQEEVVGNDILFNYQLYEGRAASRNAIRLLGIMGYDEIMIQAAEEMAEYFICHGEWK